MRRIVAHRRARVDLARAAGPSRRCPRRRRPRSRGEGGLRRLGRGAANGHACAQLEADPRARGRRARRRVAPGDLRRALRGARSHASSRVHAERSARAEAVVPLVQRLLLLLDHAARVRADPGRGHRLRRRRGPSGPRGQDPRCEELRRWLGARRHARPRHVRRGPHRGRPRQRHRYRGPRAVVRAPDREGRDQVACDPRRRGGAGDPLGGRQRRAGNQHEPRRHPGSTRSGP